jgi:hypothetical protein
MSKFIIGLFAAIIFTGAGAGPVSAQTPLDPTGQLSGFIPPSQGGLACTRYVNKRVTIMPLRCALQCAVDFAAATSRGLTFDNDYCEETWLYSCKNQYTRALEKLDQGICMNCLDEPARQALYPTYRDAVSVAKDQIFCDDNPANTPFPDGHGSVSQQRDVVKCQNQVMRSLMKAAKCLNLHCHQKTAETLYWGKPIRVTNAQCEDEDVVKSCKARFDLSMLKLGTGCPACLDKDAVWTSFQQALDTNNGAIYCSDQ